MTNVIIPNVILLAALANYNEDINNTPEMRSLQPSEFRALHDTLVSLGVAAPLADDSTLHVNEDDDDMSDLEYFNEWGETRDASYVVAPVPYALNL